MINLQLWLQNVVSSVKRIFRPSGLAELTSGLTPISDKSIAPIIARAKASGEPASTRTCPVRREMRHAANAKVNFQEAQDIRRIYSPGKITLKELATIYEVSESQISKIVRGGAWIENRPKRLEEKTKACIRCGRPFINRDSNGARLSETKFGRRKHCYGCKPKRARRK